MATKRVRILLWRFVAVVAVAVAIVLIYLAPQHAPVRRGTVDDFWQAALHLDPSDSLGGPIDAYYVNLRWCAYESRHFHGSILYAVPMALVQDSFDDVVQRLVSLSQEDGEKFAVRVYEKWLSDNDREPDVRSLIDHASKAELERWSDDVEMLAYVIGNEQSFWRRWHRQTYFWATIFFEWILFTGLALWVAWPLLRAWSPPKIGFCLALVPALLILPVYFGYATYTFTSHGPAGGVLYPYVVMFLPRISNAADHFLLRSLPPLLEAISIPIGEPMALTGMGVPSLTYAVALAVICGIALATFGRFRNSRS